MLLCFVLCSIQNWLSVSLRDQSSLKMGCVEIVMLLKKTRLAGSSPLVHKKKLSSHWGPKNHPSLKGVCTSHIRQWVVGTTTFDSFSLPTWVSVLESLFIRNFWAETEVTPYYSLVYIMIQIYHSVILFDKSRGFFRQHFKSCFAFHSYRGKTLDFVTHNWNFFWYISSIICHQNSCPLIWFCIFFNSHPSTTELSNFCKNLMWPKMKRGSYNFDPCLLTSMEIGSQPRVGIHHSKLKTRFSHFHWPWRVCSNMNLLGSSKRNIFPYSS